MARSRALSPLYVEPELPRWWDWTIVLLTIASLAILVVEMLLEDESVEATALRWIDAGVCAVFVLDFSVRLARAPRRAAFLWRNWIDLLGAIPLIGPLRTLRAIRVIRILRFTRIAVLSRRLFRRFDLSLPTETLGYLGLIALLVWLGAGALFYGFEAGINDGVEGIDDALWWSMTTLSTVGYGDLYPVTPGGRMVALVTMVVGVGVLGTLAATIAAAFIDLRERGRKGLRSYRMSDHLLVLNWNDRAAAALDDFRHDPRHEDTRIVIVADLEATPIEDARVRFVRGEPGRSDVLTRASAGDAAVAIVFASDPRDPRSDHETALILLALRELNPSVTVSAELVSPAHREFLMRAGCDSAVDVEGITATLLVRSVQDVGVSDVIEELLSNKWGVEIYRIPVHERHLGAPYRDYCVAMHDRDMTVLGIVRERKHLLNPKRDLRLEPGDEAFVVAEEPPEP